eukprot:s375_g7.t2
MAQVRATDLHQLHAQINNALCTAAAKVFPARRLADDRISAQAGFRASAKLTWQLYAAMRRPRPAAAKNILQKWRAAAAFHKASRQLREQSRALKKQAFQVKLAQAEAAAVKQDQRTLHQIVRSLSRAPRKQFSRLRDHEGRLLSKAAEAQALVDQGRLTYSLYPDLQLNSDMSDSFEVTDEELVAQLRAAKPGKAVPPHIAPAACWRLCADLVGPCLGTAMREHFRQGRPGLLHGDLTDATMAMLPKPGKPEHLLANLRPIGLMAPTSKSLAGILRNRMLEWQLPHLVVRPQFAYVPNRGTMDALLRIHKHLDDAARLIRSNRVDRFGQHSGRKPLAFTGALSLSLDLSRAFDLTDRPCLFRALRDYQIPQAVVEVAQRLHFGARFMYKAGDYQAHFTPTNGLKQGCRLAPCLWVWYTLTLMDTLESRLPQGWIDNVLTLFADDCWGSWLLHSLSDLRKALSELAILLCTLEDYKMQINYSKTAVLLKFVGKHAKQALHEITVMKNGVRHLRLVVHDVERLIPIKDSHEHAEACPVLYQICLAAAYLEQRASASSALPPAMPQDDNGDGHQLGTQSGCGHLPALPGLADGAAPPAGTHDEGRQGQQAPSPGPSPATTAAGPATTLHAFFGGTLHAARCQEDLLAELRMDKMFVLFIREDAISVLPSLYQVSKEYHQQQEEGTLTAQSSLRTLLLACMMKQLRDRINHMLSTQEGTRKLQTAGWVMASQEWTRHKWCRQAKRLVIDTEAPPVAHTSLMESIDFLLANLRGDVVQKFHSTQNLGKMEAAQTHTATFFLSISLRGPTAEQVHTRFTSLLGITALQLIGLSMKRATLQRSQLAQQVAALAFGR